MTVRPPMISRRHGFSSVGIYEGLKRAPFWRGGGDIIRSAFGRMEGVRGYNSKRFWPLCTVPGSEYSVNSCLGHEASDEKNRAYSMARDPTAALRV